MEMKSKLVKWFKENDVRKINGKKVENINFYELCGYKKLIAQGVTLDINK